MQCLTNIVFSLLKSFRDSFEFLTWNDVICQAYYFPKEKKMKIIDIY